MTICFPGLGLKLRNQEKGFRDISRETFFKDKEQVHSKTNKRKIVKFLNFTVFLLFSLVNFKF